MGVCTAYFLSHSPEYDSGTLSITLVEEGDIAGGASGKAAGFIAKDWHPPSTTPLCALSFDLHSKLAQQYNGNEQWGYRSIRAYSVDIKPPSRRRKKGDHSARELKAGEMDAPTRELPHEEHWLSIPSGKQEELGKALGWLDQDAVDVMQQLGDDGTTAQLHPGLFVNALGEQAQKKGVKFLRGKAVGATTSTDGKSLSSITVSTSAGQQQEFPLDKLLLAAGPWTGSLSRQLGITSIPVFDLPGHSIIYKPTRPLEAECLFSRISDKGVTNGPELFTRPDGTIYIAGQNTGGPLPPGGTADVQLQESDLEKLRGAMAILSPELTNGEIVKTQLCYRPVTKQGTPFLSPVPSHTNVWCCAGSGPWGIEQGPGCGLIMSEMLLGKKLSADVSQLALPGESSPLP